MLAFGCFLWDFRDTFIRDFEVRNIVRDTLILGFFENCVFWITSISRFWVRRPRFDFSAVSANQVQSHIFKVNSTIHLLIDLEQIASVC